MTQFVTAMLMVCVFGNCESRPVKVQENLCGYSLTPNDITLTLRVRCDLTPDEEKTLEEDK